MVVSSVTVITPVTILISWQELSEQVVVVIVVIPISVVVDVGASEILSTVRTSSNVVVGPAKDSENSCSSVCKLSVVEDSLDSIDELTLVSEVTKEQRLSEHDVSVVQITGEDVVVSYTVT